MTHDTTAKKTTELLTLEESAEFSGVSERTIQRHALLSRHNPTGTTIRKGKKLKGYKKDWLTEIFINGATEDDKKKDKNKDVSDMVSVLKGQVQTLSDEIKFKNEQLQVKDRHITSLIESDKNTKTLLADLQIQNKVLQLSAPEKSPTIKQSGKKSYKVWLWLSIVLLMGLTGGAYAYNYYFGFKNLNW